MRSLAFSMTDSQAQPLPPGAADQGGEATGTERSTCGNTAGNDQKQFVSQLFARHRESLMRHLVGLLSRRADAEDVLQETCARLLKVPHLDRAEGRARAYMFRIATNLAYDTFRLRSAESLEGAETEAVLSSPSQQPDCIVSFEQGFELIKRTLLELKPRCRRVFLLRATEELSYEAIAERLGISKRTVEREMKHALDTCQRRLKR
jgi:RNA polymerase sigma factor (sigma-70 family)